MAKGNTKFKKGHPGGPGRPPDPPEVRSLAKLTSAQFTAMLGKFSRLTREQCDALVADPKTPVLELCVLRVLDLALKEGDPKYVNWLTERLYGRVKEQVEIKTPKPSYIELPGSTIELGTTIEAEVLDPDSKD